MSNIDERIVKMTFDHKEFEKNVKSTSKALDGLKEDLKLDGLTSNIQAIADRFSTLGIVSMTVLQDITRKAIETGKKIASSILTPLFEGGKRRALNIEHAMFQFEGLGMDVEKALDSANKAVLGTAFGLDEAAKVAAQFGATGLKAGDDMTNALRGISGVAAMTGSSYEDIGNIFIKVAGNGRLMGQELLQLSGRGINAAATLANYLGKSEQEVRKMVSAGLIDFETFYKAMNDTFGDHATKANETFKGALSNMKAALSRIGADFYGPWLVSIRNVMNAIRPMIDGVRKSIGPLVEWGVKLVDNIANGIIKTVSNLDTTQITQYLKPVLDLIENLYSVAKSVIVPIKKAFSNIFPKKTHDQIAGGIAAVSEFIKGLQFSTELSDKATTIFEGFFSIFSVIKSIVVDVGRVLIEALGPTLITIGNYILDFIVKIAETIVRFKKWWEESKTLQKILSALGYYLKLLTEKTFSGLIIVVDKLRAAFKRVTSAGSTFGDVVRTLFENISKVINKSKIIDIFTKLWELLKVIVKSIWDLLKQIGSGIAKIFGGLTYDKVLETLKTGGFIALVSIIKKQFGKKSIFDNVNDMLSSFKNILTGVSEALNAFTLNIHADSLLKIAGAVGILAISLIALSSINSESLAMAIASITLLFTNLGLMLSSMMKMQAGGKSGITGSVTGIFDAFSFSTMAKSLTSIATAILVLSVALKIVAGIDKDEITKGILAITAMSGIIIGIVAAFKKIEPKKLSGVAGGLILISTSLLIMARAMRSIAKLSWEELAKGLTGVVVVLGTLAGFTAAAGGWKHMMSTGLGITAIATAMVIMASAFKKFASLSWVDLAKGVAALGASLLVITLALKNMPEKKVFSMSVGLMAIGVALQLIYKAVYKFSSMSWTDLGKGMLALATSLGILAAALNLMKGTVSGSAALLVATAALLILVPVLKTLGKMSWESIAKGLVALAGAFTIIGIAAHVLKPMILTITALSSALILFGGSLALIGVGVFLISASLGTLGAGIAGLAIGIKAAIMAIITLIPDLLVAITQGIAKTVGALKDTIVDIVSLVISLAVELLKGLKEVIPEFISLLGTLLDGLLPFIKEQTPKLIQTIIETLIDSLKVIKEKLPELVEIGVSVVLSILDGIMDSLDLIIETLVTLFVKAIRSLTKIIKNTSSEIATALAELIKAFIGLIFDLFKALLEMPSGDALPVIETMSTAILALSGAMFLVSKVPISGAITGAIGLAAFVGIFAGILAALGGISKIPGVQELLANGSELLNQLGGAIGSFAGSIVAGFGVAASAGLPAIADSLSLFMINLQPFIDGLKQFNLSLLVSAGVLVGVMLALTAAGVVESIANFIFGTRDTLVDFGKQLADFAPHFVKYHDIIKDINPEVVVASATAAQALSTLANNLPTTGGWKGTILGEADLETFGKNLVSFGVSLVKYQETLGDGINGKLITDSANAATALSELEANLPKHGGIKGWFSGDADLGTFGSNLKAFGIALNDYHNALGDKLNANLITSSANAAMALAELEANLPNKGGIKGWFTGKQDLGDFGKNLADFGKALKDYQDALGKDGLNSKLIVDSANAAGALAELETNLPDHGGIKSWFSGDADLASFGKNMVIFAEALVDFQTALGEGINIALVQNAANAGKTLSELENNLPAHGGVVEFWAGSTSLADFASRLAPFGEGLLAFQESLGDGINIELVESAANAAKTLAEFEKALPAQGGIVQLWSGTSDMGDFASRLEPFGEGIKKFQEALGGTTIDAKLVDSAANAGKTLAELEANLPGQGGVVQFWSGKQDLGNFAEKLEPFGKGIAAFQKSLGPGINIALVSDAANAALTLAELASKLPAEGGVVQLWAGTSDLGDFAEKLEPFGKGMVAYQEALGDGIDAKLIKDSANAAETLVQLANKLPETGGLVQLWSGEKMGLDVFGENLSDFGKSLSDYGETVSGIKMEAITGSLDAVDALVLISNKLEGETGSMKSLFTGGTYTLSNLGTDLQMLGGSLKKYSDSILDLRTGNMKNANDILDDLIRIANDMQSIKGAPMTQFGADLKRLGEMGLDGYVEAFEKSDKTIKETIDAIMDSAKKAITDKQPDLESEMETAMNGVVKEIKEGAESAKTEAVFIPVGIIEAIQEEAASLRQAGEDLALEISSSASSKENIVIKAFITPIDNAIKEIKKRKPEFQDLGKDIVLGISDGMRFNTFIATQAAKNMASAVLSAAKYELSISSPSKAFREEVGRMISQGTAEGIIKDRNKAVGAASELSATILSKAKEWIADRKHFSDLTLAEEKYVLTEINKAIKKNSKERIEIKKEMYTLEQVMSSEWLADQKFYNKLTLEDEINYWKQRRELYREGTEEYKTASKELYTLERQQSSDWLDEEKFYNRISLKEELEYWKQRLKTAKKGTQEYKEIAREIYTLEKEIANIRKQYAEDQKALYENAARDRERALKTYQDQVKTAEQNLLRDVEQVNKEYENALKSRSDTLYNAYGLFSKVSVKDRVSGFDLVLNLEGQLKEFEEWQYLLESLTDKKLSEELLKELTNMGPSAVAELRGLNELTEGELVTYEELWNKKRNLADSQAIKDMHDARIKADEEITKIRTSHAEQLSELQSEYNKTLSEINSELASNLATLNRQFLESMKEINDDVETEASILEDLLKEDYEKNKEDLEARLIELTDLIKDAFTATDWAELGSGVITGIQSGINKLMPSLIKTARSVAAKTLAAIKEELGIKSPSKEGEYVGEFTIDGLINGMFKMIPKVEETAKEVGDKAIDALFIPLALIADILENDIDMSPTIRPVLDLSDIKQGTDILNRMMNGRSYSTNLAYTTSGTIRSHRQQNYLESKLEKVALGLEELNKTQESKRETPQFVQNNYSPKALSRIDIYRQTKNQFTAAKGVLDKV